MYVYVDVCVCRSVSVCVCVGAYESKRVSNWRSISAAKNCDARACQNKVYACVCVSGCVCVSKCISVCVCQGCRCVRVCQNGAVFPPRTAVFGQRAGVCDDKVYAKISYLIQQPHQGECMRASTSGRENVGREYVGREYVGREYVGREYVKIRCIQDVRARVG